jgi:hypothetical protein
MHTTKSPPKDNARILVNLLKMMVNPRTNSQELITYIETNKIDPNTYLTSVDGYITDVDCKEVHIPLIYYCCSNPNLTQFFAHLIRKGVDLNRGIVSENDDDKIELLYYSQPVYIPVLTSKGCKLALPQLSKNLEKLLLGGNIIKVMTLHKYNAITKEQLYDVVQKPLLIFRVLDILYQKIYVICQQIHDKNKLKQITSELITNYCNVFKLFFKNGQNVNQMENGETFFNRIINTYFIDIIKSLINYNPDFDNIEIVHYSNFDLTNRQVMSIFYN